VFAQEKAVKVIQTVGRGIIFRYKWMRIIFTRRNAAQKVQRFYRGYRGRVEAKILRMQQWSDWEQLWDERRQMFYYYNIVTKESSYEAPTSYFRPMVRHLRSSALIQAWPFLDEDPKRSVPGTASTVADHLLCTVCYSRRAVRRCDVCTAESVSVVSSLKSSAFFMQSPGSRDKHAIFCFPCFTRAHTDDPIMRQHPFRDLQQQLQFNRDSTNPSNYLRCCECDEPATRKCLGILTDEQIDDIIGKLRKTSASEWLTVLRQTDVSGENKLNILLSDLQTESILTGSDYLTTVQLQTIRTALERTRAECDECYCKPCYQIIHSGGRRARHKWRGFQKYSSVCSVCIKSAADVQCTDCESALFCSSCYKVFHGRGRKKKHNHINISEYITEDQTLCQRCSRRVATDVCTTCGFTGCDSCYEVHHKPECERDTLLENEEEVPSNVCVLCGEAADKKCMQCGDLFCSRIWMGNPGCFAKLHHKGNRMLHTLEDYTAPAAPTKVIIRRKSSIASKSGPRTATKSRRQSFLRTVQSSVGDFLQSTHNGHSSNINNHSNSKINEFINNAKSKSHMVSPSNIVTY